MLGQNIKNFMGATLGKPAADALVKAAERSPGLASALPARTILSWLQFSSRFGYEGEIPGIPNSYIQFAKSAPETFSGYVEMEGPTGPEGYEFRHAGLLHLAAAVAVAMGEDQPVDPQLRDLDIAKLGKNIDVLIGTRFLSLAKKQQAEASESTEESIDKDEEEARGAAAAPREPAGPTQAVPQRKQPRISKPKPQAIKITKAQSERECQVCGATQFDQGELVFCYCLRDLKKFALAYPDADDFVVEFGKEWTDSDVTVFLDMVGDE